MVESIVSSRKSIRKDFPIIKKSRLTDLIVLFTDVREGVVLNSSEYNIGSHSDEWIESTDNDVWENFEGEIVLRNK